MESFSLIILHLIKFVLYRPVTEITNTSSYSLVTVFLSLLWLLGGFAHSPIWCAASPSIQLRQNGKADRSLSPREKKIAITGNSSAFLSEVRCLWVSLSISTFWQIPFPQMVAVKNPWCCLWEAGHLFELSLAFRGIFIGEKKWFWNPDTLASCKARCKAETFNYSGSPHIHRLIFLKQKLLGVFTLTLRTTTSLTLSFCLL